MKKWGLLLILLLSLLPRTTFAEETADAICIEGETEGLDTDAVDVATEENGRRGQLFRFACGNPFGGI